MSRHSMATAALSLATFALGIPKAPGAARPKCQTTEDTAHRTVGGAMPVAEFRTEMPGLQLAAVQDPTNSTGATLFYFTRGGRVAVDVRGGSPATSEIGLVNGPGTYSNLVDGVVFAGGSTMGLAAGDGVRQEIFRARARGASAFDAIPSMPSAVVYDFEGRTHDGADPLVFPTNSTGSALWNARSNRMQIGRAGAGVCTTCNKMTVEGRWGGQGALEEVHPWGRIFAGVVVNALGDVDTGAGHTTTGGQMPRDNGRKNTTLSIIVTDVPLDRTQLQRLAIMVHTGMAQVIYPFHTYCDGDVNFAVSVPSNRPPISGDHEMELQMAASRLMNRAVRESVLIANGYRP